MKKLNADVLVDDEAWTRAGEELKRVDPQRYISILQVVEDICAIHRNPLAEVAANGFYMFQGKKTGQLD